ncbi:MAG: hypothetical protein ACRD44_05710 [Bryobacteraceae bacterium]
MTHPGDIELALYAGGESGLLSRLRLARHLRACGACQAQVRAFRENKDWLEGAARQLPEDIAWGRLAAEMRANIRLGLAAGECVAVPAEVPRSSGWRVAAALASVAVLLASGWLLHLPKAVRVEPRGILLGANDQGIELRENGRSMTILHGSAPVVSVRVEGSLRARYVDGDTGQVTIHHVYAQ